MICSLSYYVWFDGVYFYTNQANAFKYYLSAKVEEWRNISWVRDNHKSPVDHKDIVLHTTPSLCYEDSLWRYPSSLLVRLLFLLVFVEVVEWSFIPVITGILRENEILCQHLADFYISEYILKYAYFIDCRKHQLV